MKSKLFRLLLTEGSDEKIVSATTRECFPDMDGIINPPIRINHEGRNFILKRQWDMLPDAYVYTVTQIGDLDVLLSD